ncbi:MAG: YiiD C-terminal domain-containing protein [Opitutae bacterium]|nr:YiiD C-terminal domain-containing protein [Opitutae bacterium]
MLLSSVERLKLNLLLLVFGWKDVPLIGAAGVRLVELDDARCVVCVPLKRRNKNHLGSMYFGALAIGADCAGAMMAFFENRRRGYPVNFVFKDFHADFIKRPEADTLFTCAEVAAVRAAFDETQRTGERVNVPLRVTATTPAKLGTEPVAVFQLTLSLKKKAARK